MAWQNADGLLVKDAQYFKDPRFRRNKPTGLNTAGAKNQIEVDFDLTLIPDGTVSFSSDLNNDGTLDGFNLGDVYIPANGSVLQVLLVMTEAAAGGTSIKVGTFTQAGAAIDDDGLVTTTEGVTANMNAIGKRVYGNGAHVATTAGTAGVGTADAYIAITAAGTFTAGKGRLIIEYVQSLPDAP